MEINNHIIITDSDGVLTNWELSFFLFMKDRYDKTPVHNDAHTIGIRYGIPKTEMFKFIKEFNASGYIKSLAPHKNAIRYVKKLHEEYGYVFHVVTSLGLEYQQQRNRIENLQSLFGNSVFHDFSFVDIGASKEVPLKPYENSGCVYIDDHLKHVSMAASLGLTPIYMRGLRDKSATTDDEIPVVYDWQGVYNLATGNRY